MVVVLASDVLLSYDLSMSQKIKVVFELPPAQQRVLQAILQLQKSVFHTSEVARKIESFARGKAAGGVLGALYRNGYLKKLSGGRDKTWRLSDEAIKARDELKQHIGEVKVSWS